MSLHVVYGFQDRTTGVTESSMVGVIVSRGSAAGISFLFPYMLLTVCRNLITMCRETFLNRYIPFDSAIDLHRLMALTAIILTGQNLGWRLKLLIKIWMQFIVIVSISTAHRNHTIQSKSKILAIWHGLAYFFASSREIQNNWFV